MNKRKKKVKNKDPEFIDFTVGSCNELLLRELLFDSEKHQIDPSKYPFGLDSSWEK